MWLGVWVGGWVGGLVGQRPLKNILRGPLLMSFKRLPKQGKICGLYCPKKAKASELELFMNEEICRSNYYY